MEEVTNILYPSRSPLGSSGSFILDQRLLVLRVDPVIADMDESTTHILQHIKWATSKGPLRTDENNWQPELVLDVCTLAPQQDNACD